MALLTDDDITPETARWVLHYFGAGGCPSGTFTEFLMRALGAADVDNFAKLESVFPELTYAFRLGQYSSDGIPRLMIIADR